MCVLSKCDIYVCQIKYFSRHTRIHTYPNFLCAYEVLYIYHIFSQLCRPLSLSLYIFAYRPTNPPPSTGSTAPFTYEPALLDRYMHDAPISSGLPTRPITVEPPTAFLPSSVFRNTSSIPGKNVVLVLSVLV